jgi:transcriptional regulator with XRE-family HTH domain
MSKSSEKIKARELRKEGVSIILIARRLGVSKSSVSSWCHDIRLTREQVRILEKNKGVSYKTGQRLGAETNRNKKITAINDADDFGKKSIRNISDKELLLIATALYWCEGAKTDTTSTFMFVNSDPEMILIMKKFLVKVLKVSLNDIVCTIQINKIHKQRIDDVLIFWKKLLELDNNHINKPYFVKTKANKVYENYDTYYGVCRLFVRKGKNLQYRMRGLIKAMRFQILSA